MYKSNHRRCSIRKECSLKCCKIHRKTPGLESFARTLACNFIKIETPAQVFCCDFCEFFKSNTGFLSLNFENFFRIYFLYRGSHQRCSMKKGVLENFTKFARRHLARVSFNKVAGLRPSTLLKKRLWHRSFPMNFMKFLRTLFLQNTSGRLQNEEHH